MKVYEDLVFTKGMKSIGTVYINHTYVYVFKKFLIYII